MIVRPFSWRDLPLLYRYRNHGVHLDSIAAVTRGSPVLPGALVSILSPAAGVFTCVMNGYDPQDTPLIAQFEHTPGARFAQMTYLAPAGDLDTTHTSPLLDYITMLSGERGAMRLLAEVDEQTAAFDALHKGGFMVFSRQRIWLVESTERDFALTPEAAALTWRLVASRDIAAIQTLYASLVPSLVQQCEAFDAGEGNGLVLYQEGDLIAYVELHYGYKGIWALPFIRQGYQASGEAIQALLVQIPYRLSRPVYLCVRSYQSQLEGILSDLGATPGPRQAVMARHMASREKAARPIPLPSLEGRQPEITSPISNLEFE